MRVRPGLRLSTIALAAICGAACSLDSPTPAPAPRTLRIGTSADGGGFLSFAQALEPELQARLGNFDVRMELSRGAVDNLLGVSRGDVECAFTYADVAYEALTLGRLQEQDVSMSDVRAIAVLQVTPVQLIARAGADITRILDLRGKRVSLGGQRTATMSIARLLLEAHGIENDVRPVTAPPSRWPAMMAAGEVDALFGIVMYAEGFAVSIAEGAHLVPITGGVVDRLRAQRPFMRRVLVPTGTYGSSQEAVPTIGLESLMVCRRELEDVVVHDLTRALLEALQQLARSKRWNLVPLDEAPATSIPLHSGAALYYRELELRR